jgi:hypothetical protein
MEDEKEYAADRLTHAAHEKKNAGSKDKNKKRKTGQDRDESEIEDSLLLRIALITGIIGTIALYLVGENVTIGETSIGSINSPEEGKVLVRGYVENVVNKENVVVIDIAQKDQISVVFFPNQENSEDGKAYCSRCDAAKDISAGDRIEVLGSLSSYKNRTELIAEQITRIG